jgi:hypothetical protein
MPASHERMRISDSYDSFTATLKYTRRPASPQSSSTVLGDAAVLAVGGLGRRVSLKAISARACGWSCSITCR